MKEDSELVKEYMEGNEAAMKELVERHINPVYSFIYRLTGMQNDAPDIAQEAFIKMWKNLKRYDPKQSFKAWMMAIARNTAIDWMRKRRILMFSDMNNESESTYFEDTLADQSPIAEDLFEEKEKKEMLESEIAKLSMDDREVVILHNAGDMSFEEISQILKKPVNTVKSRYRRALLKMRESIERTKMSI